MAEPYAPLLGRKKLVGAAVETTAGTAANVTTPLANTTLYDVKCEPGDFYSDGKRMPDGHYLGTVDSILGKQTAKVSFTMDLRPGDAFLTVFILAAGYKAVNSVLTPSSDIADHKTLTFKVWEDGRVKTVVGASCGKTTLSGTNGGRVKVALEYDGVWGGVADAAMPAMAPLPAGVYTAKGMTFTMGGAVMPFAANWELDLGLASEEREAITAATGIVAFLTTEREPKITIDPEARLVAQNDAYGLLLSGATAAAVLAMTCGTSTLTITAARTQRQTVSTETRGKRLADKLVLACHNSAGDDDVTLAEVTGG